MALTPSGAISLGDINTALGRSATAAISMNDTEVRFISTADTAGSAITMNSLRNKYYFNGTITVGTYNDKGSIYYGYDSVRAYGSITGTLFGSNIYQMYIVNQNSIGVYTNNAVVVSRSTYRIQTYSGSTYNTIFGLPNTTSDSMTITDFFATWNLYGSNDANSVGLTYNWQISG